MEYLPINCEISPDGGILDKYNSVYGWVPSSYNIRCDDATQTKKNDEITEMREKWDSPEDFISFRIFNDNFEVNSKTGLFRAILNKRQPILKSKTQPLDWLNDIVFRQNDFPYGGLTCNHWVLWYRTASCPPCRSIINDDLKKKLMEFKGLNDPSTLQEYVSFIWYENPKRNSLSQHFHVQVFWIDH